jgi:hypothetical protein
MKWILLLIVCFNLSLAHARRAQDLMNQSYGRHERNVFDLWLPKSLKKTPLVIYIHGGGWVMGDKSEIHKHDRLIKKYRNAGVAFATINYRFLKHANLQTIMREDIGGFVQFMRANHQRYNINKEKIMVFGVSAGGSASLWLATHDDLADPNHENPLMRESTRVLAAGHVNSQVSYDFHDWFNFFGADQVNKFLGSQVWSRYHFDSLGDLYTQEGELVRRFLDSYENYSSDDPEIFFYNSLKNFLPAENGDQFLHHPLHAILLHERAQAVGAKSVLMLDGDSAIKHSPFNEIQKFFFGKLKKKEKRESKSRSGKLTSA